MDDLDEISMLTSIISFELTKYIFTLIPTDFGKFY